MNKTQFLTIVIFVFAIGCATGSGALIRFQDREYLIHPDKPFLSFPYKVIKCKKIIGIIPKCNTIQKFDNIDMNSDADRRKMINAGFTCKSKMRFKY